jgi:epoxyqueuosine reductase QueG
VRLATVFTDLELPAGDPVTQSACGSCRLCVDACPAGCGRDVQWRAGTPREQLFDAVACHHHMSLFTGVENDICGICIAACPRASH